MNKLNIGDIFLVTDISNSALARHWYGSENCIEFKTKTTKPVLYIVMPRNWDVRDLEIYPLNPLSQFKTADNSPNNYYVGTEKDSTWMSILRSLKYLGSVDEATQKILKDPGDNYSNWAHLRKIRKELFNTWSAKAKEQGFVEEPVAGYARTEHLEYAFDFIGQKVQVGDTVAYVHLGSGQSLSTGTVVSITKNNFVIGEYPRPHKYVIKIDPTKIRK